MVKRLGGKERNVAARMKKMSPTVSDISILGFQLVALLK